MDKVENLKKKGERELKFLIRDFYELNHLLHLVQEAKENNAKGELENFEVIRNELFKKLRGGILGGEERIELRMARNYKRMKDALIDVEKDLPEADVKKINSLLENTDVFDNALKVLGSRGGDIENALREAKEDPEKIETVQKLIEEAITDVRGFKLTVDKLIECIETIDIGREVGIIRSWGRRNRDISLKSAKLRDMMSGKNIRLYYHNDLDGAVAALLVKLYSGAAVIELIPCFTSSFLKKPNVKDVLDVFVDCRAKEGDEHIRLDHHYAGEKKEYLSKEGIIVDTRYDSTVTLIAKVLDIKLDKLILETMDLSDSGRKNALSGFKLNRNSLNNIITNMDRDDLRDFSTFKSKILSFMDPGSSFGVITDTAAYEQMLNQNYGIIIEDVKKTKKKSPLTKIIYISIPVEEPDKKKQNKPANKSGSFNRGKPIKIIPSNPFKMTRSDFFTKVKPYLNENYFEKTISDNFGVYVVVGFLNSDLSPQSKDPEPYKIFVARSQFNAYLDVGRIIDLAKKKANISTGGGRPDVGGMDTDKKNKAIDALNYIIDFIRRRCTKKRYI